MVLYHPDPVFKLFWPMEEGKIKPSVIMDEFFSAFDIENVLKELWDLTKAAIDSDSKEGEGENSSNYIFLYEKLHDLIVACYIRAQKVKLKKDNAVTH